MKELDYKAMWEDIKEAIIFTGDSKSPYARGWNNAMKNIYAMMTEMELEVDDG